MNKRQLLQAIERMPNEAEVEIHQQGDPVGTADFYVPTNKAELVDGKIRIS